MIPKSFQLINKKWTVHILKEAKLQSELDRLTIGTDTPDAHQLLGWCHEGSRRIFLNADQHKSDDQLRDTFYHELIHAIFYAEGLTEHDEQQVERFGAFLCQYEDTKKPR